MPKPCWLKAGKRIQFKIGSAPRTFRTGLGQQLSLTRGANSRGGTRATVDHPVTGIHMLDRVNELLVRALEIKFQKLPQSRTSKLQMLDASFQGHNGLLGRVTAGIRGRRRATGIQGIARKKPRQHAPIIGAAARIPTRRSERFAVRSAHLRKAQRTLPRSGSSRNLPASRRQRSVSTRLGLGRYRKLA